MQGRHVLITGGSRGIGAALVRRFWESGQYQVSFTYHRSKENAEAICANYGHPELLRAFPLDLADQASLVKSFDMILRTAGPVSVLIHNAAQKHDELFMQMTAESWEQVLWPSLNSFFYLNQGVLPEMLAQRWGRIIIMVSLSAESGRKGQTHYAAAKGALIAAGKSLAKEMGRKGILTNMISPGWIETDMSQGYLQAEVLREIPLGRAGRPEEVAHLAYFLASEEASYINGAVIPVHGGLGS